MRQRLRAMIVVAAACASLAERVSACTGDCNGDGSVTIDEVVRGVSSGLQIQMVESCPRFDPDRNRRVTIGELIQGVGAALTGCVAGITNIIVNDRLGQACSERCAQNETSIAVLGSNLVIGYSS